MNVSMLSYIKQRAVAESHRITDMVLIVEEVFHGYRVCIGIATQHYFFTRAKLRKPKKIGFCYAMPFSNKYCIARF